jgi:hypothetical protein
VLVEPMERVKELSKRVSSADQDPCDPFHAVPARPTAFGGHIGGFLPIRPVIFHGMVPGRRSGTYADRRFRLEGCLCQWCQRHLGNYNICRCP